MSGQWRSCDANELNALTGPSNTAVGITPASERRRCEVQRLQRANEQQYHVHMRAAPRCERSRGATHRRTFWDAGAMRRTACCSARTLRAAVVRRETLTQQPRRQW